MTENEFRDGMFSIVRSIMGTEALELSRETTANDVAGWDSLKHVKIILKVEEKFKIRLSSREIDGLGNVGDFVRLIAAQTNRPAALACAAAASALVRP